MAGNSHNNLRSVRDLLRSLLHEKRPTNRLSWPPREAKRRHRRQKLQLLAGTRQNFYACGISFYDGSKFSYLWWHINDFTDPPGHRIDRAGFDTYQSRQIVKVQGSLLRPAQDSAVEPHMRKPNCPMWLSMIQLRWRVGSKLDLALDDFHPWQNAHAASFDLGSSALAPIRSNRVILGAASVHAYSARGSHEICRRERISVPAKIARQPFYHLEPAGPMRALEPAGRHLADAPAEPVTFHQELDAITESAIGLDCDLVNHSAREQPKAVAGVVRRQTGEMVKGEIGGAHQCGLQPGAADHAATGHKAAGTDDVATLCRRCHHR